MPGSPAIDVLLNLFGSYKAPGAHPTLHPALSAYIDYYIDIWPVHCGILEIRKYRLVQNTNPFRSAFGADFYEGGTKPSFRVNNIAAFCFRKTEFVVNNRRSRFRGRKWGRKLRQ